MARDVLEQIFYFMRFQKILIHIEEFGNKHFFGFYDFNNNEKEDETFFIGIIRNPIEWIDSFVKKPHHIPDQNKESIHAFLFNSFYSLYDDTKLEIMEDRNLLTKTERYKNIFELRKVKNDFLSKTMPEKVKHYLLIRYEDLRDNYNKLLEFIEMKFKLKRKHPQFIPIDAYKGKMQKGSFVKKPVILMPQIINQIKKNLDIEQEKSFGYLLKHG